MNKQLFFIPALLLLGLFSLGILVDISVVDDSDDVIEVIDRHHYPVAEPLAEPYTSEQSATPDSTQAVDTDSDEAYSQSLEYKVTDIEARIFEKAGINEARAEEIIRLHNELELSKFELNERATREEFIDTPRYTSEYSALVANETTLRDELGDDAYDSYLFTNDQSNRVKVVTVNDNSVADAAGMKVGDLIVSYGQDRIFDWSEIKQTPVEGVVNIGIVRDGKLISLSVPGGLFGVRFGMISVSP